MRAILDADKVHCPKGIRGYAQNFWSDEIEDAVQAADEAKHRWETTGAALPVAEAALLREEVYRLRVEARALIRTRKREKFHEACEAMSPLDSNSWRLLQGIRNHRQTDFDGQALRDGTRYARTPSAKAEVFAAQFAAVSTRHPEAPLPPHLHSRKPSHPAEAMFSMPELDASLDRMATGKACGVDNVYAEHLKHLGPGAKDTLLRLTNSSFRTGVLPRRWLQSIIVALLKNGKPSDIPASYRPVSLTSVICRCVERMIANRLVHYLETHGCLPDEQSGFRKTRSTVDQLAALVDVIVEAFNTRMRRAEVSGNETSGRVLAVFVGWMKAFDKVDHGLLISKLRLMQVPHTIVRWIANFLQDRTANVRVGTSYSRTKRTTCGVPQGSVLGPILFIIFMSDLSRLLRTLPGVHHGFFADDLTLCTTGMTAQEAVPPMQRALDVITTWSRRNFLPVSLDKTEYMVFSRSNHSEQDVADLGLTLDGVAVKRADLSTDTALRYLGVRHDHFLHFGHHIDYLESNAADRLAQLAAACGSDWGPTSHDIRTFFCGHVLSVLTYGAEVWYPKLARSNVDRIDGLMHRGMRIVSGCSRSTNLSDLPKEAHLTPMADIVAARGVALIERYRRLDGLRHTVVSRQIRLSGSRPFPHFRTPHEELADEVCHQNAIPTDHIREPLKVCARYAPWEVGEARNITINVQPYFTVPQELESTNPAASVQLKNFSSSASLMLLQQDTMDYELWTDGSVTGSGTPSASSGGAALLFHGRHFVSRVLQPAGRLACPYRAECVAMKGGLAECVRRLWRPAKLLVCTDSQSLLAALHRGPLLVNSTIEKDIWDMLLILARRGISVTLQFVYSHCGIDRNELVDRQAARAASGPGQHAVPVWHTDFVAATKRYLQAQRAAHAPQRTYRDTIVTLGSTSLQSLSLPRADATLLAQFRTNECPHLGRLAHRLGISMVTSCRWCCAREHSNARPPVARVRHSAQNASLPVRCPHPGCNHVASNRANCATHMERRHGLSRVAAFTAIIGTASSRSRGAARSVDPSQRIHADRRRFVLHVAAIDEDAPLFTQGRFVYRCPHPHCNMETVSSGGLSRHINTAHPELRRPPGPRYSSSNFVAAQGDGCLETPHHILCECVALTNLRSEIFGSHFMYAGRSAPWFDVRTAQFVRRALTLLPNAIADI